MDCKSCGMEMRPFRAFRTKKQYEAYLQYRCPSGHEAERAVAYMMTVATEEGGKGELESYVTTKEDANERSTTWYLEKDPSQTLVIERREVLFEERVNKPPSTLNSSGPSSSLCRRRKRGSSGSTRS